MDKKLGLFLSALVLFAGIAGANAYAHGQEGGMWGADKKHGASGKEYGLEGVFFHKAVFFLKSKDKIGLSQDQVVAIKALKLETEKGVLHQKADLKALELDIRSQLHSDMTDAGALSKLIDQKYEMKKTMEKSLVAAIVKLKSMLTPAQQETLKKLRKEKRSEKTSHRHWFSGSKEKAADGTGSEQ